MYRQATLAGAPARGGPPRRARAAYDDVPGVAHLSEEVQPGPRRRPDRPLAGHVRAPSGHRQGDRPQAGGPADARVGAPARRQRDRESTARTWAATSSTCRPAAPTARSGAWWPSRPSTPGARERHLRPHDTAGMEVLCTNPAALGGGARGSRRSTRALRSPRGPPSPPPSRSSASSSRARPPPGPSSRRLHRTLFLGGGRERPTDRCPRRRARIQALAGPRAGGCI